MHPRNRHGGRYDFARLVAAEPALAPFVRPNPYAPSDTTLDFADPQAVKALNRALLKDQYGVAGWDIPDGYLCPPIPGRADYLHHLADLLAEDAGGIVPSGPAVRLLDLGTGANGVYPLLGCAEYGWSFVASDIDRRALASLRRVLDANPAFAAAIELRLQPDPARLLDGVLRIRETFAATVCNPPFHGSAAEANEGTRRKLRNLGQGGGGRPQLNFGGRAGELWCEGGERGFLLRLITESVRYRSRCAWFTALVSKTANLTPLRAAIRAAGAAELRTVDMAQGQKKSRFLAWSFLSRAQRGLRIGRSAPAG